MVRFEQECWNDRTHWAHDVFAEGFSVWLELDRNEIVFTRNPNARMRHPMFPDIPLKPVPNGVYRYEPNTCLP